jgi:hypothetical protein
VIYLYANAYTYQWWIQGDSGCDNERRDYEERKKRREVLSESINEIIIN